MAQQADSNGSSARRTDESHFTSFIDCHPKTILIEIEAAKGSTPRETGTVMLVADQAICGTIGGGQLEFIAIENARRLLSDQGGTETMDIALGPEIGQCCGGRTSLRFTRLNEIVRKTLIETLRQEAEHRPQVWLFGAGHVGRALASALLPLPVHPTIVETRVDELQGLPLGLNRRLTPMPESLIEEIAPGAAIVILTHDHALDFLIAQQALRRNDLAYVGMIGSATKRATFSSWLKREGQDVPIHRLTLPIGGNSVRDKRPEVIAAMTTAEILVALSRHDASASGGKAVIHA